MRVLDRLRLALLMVVSAPVKPGTVHRLRLDPDYEVRLAEVTVVSRYLDEAYERGRMLAAGRVDARSLGLGRLFSQAVRDVFEFTEEKPLAGLAFAALGASVVVGYSSETGREVADEFKRLARLLVYGTGSEDTLAFLDGLEAIGYADALLELDKAGISRRLISLEDLPLGEVLEKIQSVDTGFAFNLRGYNTLLVAWRRARQSKSLVELVLRAFYELGVDSGIIPEARGNSISSHLASLDKRLEKGSTDKLLGGTAWIALMENAFRGLPPVPGLPRR